MGGKIIYRDVLEALKERANVETTITEIAHVSGIKAESVNQGIRTLRTHGSIIDTVKPGYSYIYRGEHANNENNRPTGKRIFEEVGITRAGAIVVQDEEGNIYKAEVI